MPCLHTSNKERAMVSLMMRSQPCYVESIEVAVDVPLEEALEDRVVPQAEPASVGIVVTGDNHLSPALTGLSHQRRAQRRARLRAGFSAAVDFAIVHDARLFVLAGDLFDSVTPSAQDRTFVATALARLRHAGIPCVAVSGEHDQPRDGDRDGTSPLQVYAAQQALYLFEETDTLRPRLFELGELRIAVAGLSRPLAVKPGYDPLAAVALDDAEHALDRSDVGLLIAHAPIEGLAPTGVPAGTVRRGNLATLPEKFRIIAAGHVHHYRYKRIAKRDVVVCGATERMRFDTEEGAAGFAWLRINRTGVVSARHVPIEEQPRADLVISTTRLWPMPFEVCPPSDGVDTIGECCPLPAFNPVRLLRLHLSEVCTEEAIVRLRLCGPLTREQHSELALGELMAYGRRHAFSFQLDTRGLSLCARVPRAGREDAP
jgi:hypothetical protein